MSRIIIFTHNLLTAELNCFFFEPNYGWCFDWYESEEDKKIDCPTYGKFPNDFIDQNGDYENAIAEFLKTQSKEKEIPVLHFLNWIKENKL